MDIKYYIDSESKKIIIEKPKGLESILTIDDQDSIEQHFQFIEINKNDFQSRVIEITPNRATIDFLNMLE